MEILMFMHTPKAVKDGCPGDRVFVVTGKDGNYYLAWKCTLTRSGLEHPAYKKPILFDDLRFSKGIECKALITKGKNGSEPTAVFKHDSYYKRVKIKDLVNASRDMESSASVTKPTKINLAVITTDVVGKNKTILSAHLSFDLNGKADTKMQKIFNAKLMNLVEAMEVAIGKVAKLDVHHMATKRNFI